MVGPLGSFAHGGGGGPLQGGDGVQRVHASQAAAALFDETIRRASEAEITGMRSLGRQPLHQPP